MFVKRNVIMATQILSLHYVRLICYCFGFYVIVLVFYCYCYFVQCMQV